MPPIPDLIRLILAIRGSNSLFHNRRHAAFRFFRAFRGSFLDSTAG
jgi:hypothetical protein